MKFLNHRLRPAAAWMAAAMLASAPLSGAVAQAPRTYERVASWAKLPPGETWQDMMAVAIDSKGDIYVLQRTPSKIMVFDSHGRYLRAFAQGMFAKAHGLRIDRDDNVWATDRGHHQVYKFTRDGKLLMTLGTRDKPGDNDSRDALNGPSDVVIGDNGNIFVSDGESTSTRVVKYDKNGMFLTSWGTKGTGPGQLMVPHSIVMDAKGRLYVANRGNKRIEIFDQNGGYIGQITNAGTPYGLWIDRSGVIYVSDGTKGGDEGLTVLDLATDKVLARLNGLTGAHMLTVDSKGAIYLAEVRGKSVEKFVRR